MEDEQSVLKEDENEHFSKLNGDLVMGPFSMVFQEKAAHDLKIKNDTKAKLGIKAEVPEVLGDANAVINIVLKLDRKSVMCKEAAVTVGPFTLGYCGSIFSYQKANPFLLISTDASVMQLKVDHAWDSLRLSYGIESPIELKVGWFDKNKVTTEEEEEKEDKKETEDKKGKKEKEEEIVNQLDDPKKKPKPFFLIKDSFPALGISIGTENDCSNVALNALGRLTDYTYPDATNPKKKNLPRMLHFTWGVNLGMQFKLAPACTITGQGVYVYGLGDYIAGLASIQQEEERKEMCAVYYSDKNQNVLTNIEAVGVGGTLEYEVTPQWKLTAAGSYLNTDCILNTDKKFKPDTAFKSQWQVRAPEISYKLSKRLVVSLLYDLTKESKIDPSKNEEAIHAIAGKVKFSF
ncbi:hypothetical protein [Candidatus Cardinium hertigii]|nr:hypothetical protein [Candidatus Cardinium hertigii]